MKYAIAITKNNERYLIERKGKMFYSKTEAKNLLNKIKHLKRIGDPEAIKRKNPRLVAEDRVIINLI